MDTAEPTVTILERRPGSVRARIEGGTLRADWAAVMAREGTSGPAWCEIVVHDGRDGAERWIGAYGGAVWPSAWPHLFAPRDTYNGTRSAHTITPAGLAMLDDADRAHGAAT